MPETFGLNDFAYLLLLAIIEKLNGLPDGNPFSLLSKSYSLNYFLFM